MNGYEIIKTVAADLGCRVTDILAMSTRRDPFYCGQPAQRRDAEWYAHRHNQLNLGESVHLRRIHYQLVSQDPPPIKPNGKAYQNTDKDWKWFCESAVAARTLGLVDVRHFVDRRNPAPLILRSAANDEHEQIARLSAADFWFYTIDADLSPPRLELPEVKVDGYGYTDADQPYLIEIWAEKTTQNDILTPICQQYRANLVTAAGFQSITAAINLIDRARKTGKPARIFYISDFDPAGDKMPIAVARQIEYWIRQYGLDIDIALNPIVLTEQQVSSYQLPRIPIKESDNRRGKFEARYGSGAVELDALEALYPGELARLVNEAVSPYWDSTLRMRMDAHQADVQDRISQAWARQIEPIREKVDDIEAAIAGVLERYEDELADLASRLDDDIQPYREALDGIEETVDEQRGAFDPDLPERLASDLETPDEAGWLFSSGRGYMEQISHYRREVA
jgi:hypothetical protein